METGYQRGRIQDESMLYEHRKHDGSLPIIGVNTFRRSASEGEEEHTVELARATESEKKSQLERVHYLQAEHRTEAEQAIDKLKEGAINGAKVLAGVKEAGR